MVRYWAIAPADYGNRERFEQCWQYDRANGIMAIGWDVGAPSSRDDLEAKYAEVAHNAKYAHKESWTRHGLNMLTKFWFDIQPGDRIIARAGRKRLVGVGTVQGSPYYASSKGSTWGRNFLPVSWDDIKKREFPNVVFGRHTVSELQEDRFLALTGETDVVPAEPDIQLQTEFAMEKPLEEFIVSNFSAVFGADLQLYKDDEGSYGRQYRTDVGIIDILAWEPATSSYVVMELKRGRLVDEAVGQVLRYMGWVKEHLCRQGEGVRGIIIGRDRDDRLDYALSMVENVEARFYRVDFQLSPRPWA